MRDGRMVTTRRQCCLGLLAALMAPALVGCGTGSSRPSLVSAKKERELGQEAADEVEQIVGVVSPALGGILGGVGQLARGVALAPYSREQEREADRIGIDLAARAGWDPAGLPSMLRTLEREQALAGSDPSRISFFANHPATPERVKDTTAAARTLTRGIAR